MKKKLKNKHNKQYRGLIIGPSGIGQVHLREFVKNGIKEVAILGRKFKKNRKINLISKDIKRTKIYNLKTFNEIKKFQPKVISICSPFEKHSEHLLKCKKYCKNFIVEKPFFWIKNKSEDYNYYYAKKLLKENNFKLFINLPMISLANQIIYRKKVFKVKNLKFNYFTSGRHIYNNIAVDLLPHAVSFILALQKKKLKNFKIFSVNNKKSEWRCRVLINDCNCDFHFKQNKKSKESKLSFRLNENFFVRKQVKLNNEYLTTLVRNKKRIIKVKNPMNEYLKLMLNSFKNDKNIKRNNILALDIMKLTGKLINFGKN